MDDFALQQACIDAYLSGADARHENLAYGAVLMLGGMADNGGLVGGIGELHITDSPRVIADGVAGLRRFVLTDVADLVERAAAEYRRMRPTGEEEISAEDEALWEKLDEEWFRLTENGRIDAIAVTLQQP
ncbi:hypothetical protein MWU75_13215 [Ornithinimicrobium sp. F0845]|uniref:DMP19 family protein n=1 Tax=Ornithinimicrobium sp. F0845 TaxID=2926412 RepID=UPI001FF46C55|nr:hypothetical protein [Ornithinimicrobium sp. F0845]MCK0113104.1 hypothetical protein [Ornithinimicrobium sp. F0845]